MCGRLFQTLPLNRLLRIARSSKVSNAQLHSTSFNVCPTSYIPVIKKSPLYQSVVEKQQKQQISLNEKIEQAIKEEGNMSTQQKQQNNKKVQQMEDRELTFMKWGQKTNYNMIINGRIQELSCKKTFAKIIQNRCVVIMEGYYQWKSKQQPFCFKPKHSDHFLVAALYTDQNQIIILTKDATPQLSFIHQRMPVILTPTEVQLWLDPKNTRDINIIIQKSLTNQSKYFWKNIQFAKLAPYVNKKQQKTIKCLMTIEEYQKQLDSKGLMKFWKKNNATKSNDKNQEKLNQIKNDENKQKSEEPPKNNYSNQGKQCSQQQK